MMAHNLIIGQKFEDLVAFESAITRYQNAENIQFFKRDPRSVDKAKPLLKKKLNPKIKYYEVLSTTLSMAGRNTIPRPRGSRRKICSI